MAWAEAEDAAPAMTDSGSRRATMLAGVVVCLLLGARLSANLAVREPRQVPFTVALFALPLLCAFTGTRRLLARHRWPVLSVQALLTWVPFAIFGGSWQNGIGGLLAGLVLLMLRGRLSWLLAGGLLAAEVAVRAGLTGLPPGQPWLGALEVICPYMDDALMFFGVVRLAQIVDEVEDARRQSADLAVARERLQAAQALQAGVGLRLADIAARVAAARRVLSWDAARARAQIAAAGVTAREAVARARAATAGENRLPRQDQIPSRSGGEVVIGARLAWAVLVTVLLGYTVQPTGQVVSFHYGARLTALAVGVLMVNCALQLHHSGAARRGRRPRAWPVTLGLPRCGATATQCAR